MPSKIIEKDTLYAHFLLTEGIITINYKDTTPLITESIAAKIVLERLAFQQGLSYAVMVKNDGHVQFTRSARVLLASEGLEGIRASAILLANSVDCCMAEFFIKVDQPAIPIRSFWRERRAICWLKEVTSAAISECQVSLSEVK